MMETQPTVTDVNLTELVSKVDGCVKMVTLPIQINENSALLDISRTM
jgi:hypothetical protein